MTYIVWYSNDPQSAINLEALTPRDAAAQFYSIRPKLEDCLISVGTHDSKEQWHYEVFEFLDDTARARLPKRATHASSSASSAIASSSSSDFDIVSTLTRRYADAYLAARGLIVIGSVIKWVGVGLAAVIFFAGAAMSSEQGIGGMAAFLGFAFACLIGVPTFVLGILISAQGQIHLATLDTAVNSSRHLSKDDTARILVGRNA